MGFPRQVYSNGLPFTSAEDLPNPGIKLVSPALYLLHSFSLSYPGSPKYRIDENKLLFIRLRTSQPHFFSIHNRYTYTYHFPLSFWSGLLAAWQFCPLFGSNSSQDSTGWCIAWSEGSVASYISLASTKDQEQGGIPSPSWMDTLYFVSKHLAWSFASEECKRNCIKIRPLFAMYVSSTLLQLSCWVVSNSLPQHRLQHARLPCLPPLQELTQIHVHQVGDAIQPAHPVSSLLFLPSIFPETGSFQMSQLFALGGKNIGVLASASVLPMNIQDCP